MNNTKMRAAPRVSITIHVEVRPQGKLKGLVEICMSENVSASGICFVTGLHLDLGELIEMIFIMPQELTERLVGPFRYTGRVLRIQRAKGPREKYHVAANLLWLADNGPRIS